MRTFSLSVVALMAVVPTVACGGGSVLYEQVPAPDSMLLQAASQEFPDAAEFTIFAGDDFNVSDAAGWSVETLETYFTTDNGSGLSPEGVRWIVWEDASGEPGAELLNVVSDGFDPITGVAGIDLVAGDGALALPAGDYWFTSQIIGDISSFGQEFHRGSLDGTGTSNFLWNNPGGGFGIPGGWVDANDAGLSDVSNLAFQVSGSIIPEPTTLGLLAVGSLVFLRRRG